VRKPDGSYTICLDMLEPPAKDATPYSGWSSAMSVMSILLQLQSFLNLKKLQYMGGEGAMERAQASMAEFDCPAIGCSHRGAASPWPEPRECAPQKAPRRLVCRPCGIGLASDSASPYAPTKAPPILAVDAASLSKPSASCAPTVVKSAKSNRFAALADNEDVELSEAGGAAAPAAATLPAPTVKSAATTFTPASAFVGAAAKVEQVVWAQHVDAVIAKEKAAKAAKATDCCAPPPAKPGKAAAKNAQRARRRAERREAQGLPNPSSSAAPPSSKADELGSVTEEGTSSSSVSSTADDDDDGLADEAAAAALAESVKAAAEAERAASAACFALLGYDALLILVERLHTTDDVRALACTCRHLSAVCEDGMLWRVLFHKHFPASQISAAALADWKYAYMLELSSNADRLICFHTKAELGALDTLRKRPEVFGIPLSFTVNPRTSEVDYIYSSLDTLSFSAYTDCRVRRTVWNEAFTHFLPLYLTPDHYAAAAPILRNTIRDLCASSPAWSHTRGKFVPEMALEVLPKLLCTMTVLLVDMGVAASDAFLDGFVQIYRLLLAIAREHPQLRTQVTRRVRAFVRSERARSKQCEPNLGVLVPLLALCTGLRWCDLAWPLLEEMQDRAVLWTCRDHPELARPRECSQEDLLNHSWSSRKVSNRLLMFSLGFLTRLSKVSVDELDAYRGQPSPWLRASMRAHIKRTLAVDCWPAFFSMINVPLPTKAYMQSWLTRSVANSVRKGYHKKGMDFSRVQRSGVSAILRKGESCMCQPTMKSVRFEQVWRFNGGVIFLDASALCYDFHGTPLGFVDYSHTRSVSGLVSGGGAGAVVTGGRARVALIHSGDVVDHARKEGKHTVDIDLKALSDKVGSIFLTLSAWTTTLKEIVRPEIRCYDPDERSAEPLCRYELDGKATGQQTAVTMARIHRAKAGARWQVTAIGELGMGRAGDYGPIRQTIRDLRCFDVK
jgi:hypothetical protein